MVALLLVGCAGPSTPTANGPDGGGTLTIGGASIEGSIDDRDMDVMSFSPDFPNLRGDQYTITLGSTGPFAIGVKPLMLEGMPNVVDFGIETAPSADESMATGHNAAATGMAECKILSPSSFNTGEWKIRVLTYTTLPTEEELAMGTSGYKVRVEMGTACDFDSY